MVGKVFYKYPQDGNRIGRDRTPLDMVQGVTKGKRLYIWIANKMSHKPRFHHTYVDTPTILSHTDHTHTYRMCIFIPLPFTVSATMD